MGQRFHEEYLTPDNNTILHSSITIFLSESRIIYRESSITPREKGLEALTVWLERFRSTSPFTCHRANAALRRATRCPLERPTAFTRRIVNSMSLIITLSVKWLAVEF
jgi:hypothetical protein